MFDFRSQDAKHSDASLDAGLTPAATSGHRQPWWRNGRALARVVAAGAGTGAVVAALAVPAAASGAPNIWEGAQVGLTYPVYQPKTVLGLPLSSFKLLSCRVGQDESVSATFGKAYTPISNLGRSPVSPSPRATRLSAITQAPPGRSGSGALAPPTGPSRSGCRSIAARPS